MTAPSLDPRLGPLADYLAELGPDALPAVEAWVLANAAAVPWALTLGPWTLGDDGQWARHGAMAGRVRVFERDGRWHHSYGSERPGWLTAREAMAAADDAVANGANHHQYLFDRALPPEEAT